MKKIISGIICLAMILSLSSCVGIMQDATESPSGSIIENENHTEPQEPPTEDAPAEKPTDDPTGEDMQGSFYDGFSEEEKSLYYTLWDENTAVHVKVDITPYELSKINEAFVDYQQSGRADTAKLDTYRKCNLTITVNGEEYYYDEVGVRMRGNTSLTDFCNENGEMYGFVHLRFSFDETFDGEEYAAGAWAEELYRDWSSDAAARKERKSRTFATMEKMYYKWNKNYDETYIREVYANKMFHAYGIYAPNITLTQLSVSQNGVLESLGVGGLYETVDKEFIERNFPAEKAGGDLYKCAYRGGKPDLTSKSNYGVETATQIYAYSLKTNNDRAAPDYHHNQHLKDLIDALAADKGSDSFRAGLERVVDMEYFARFEAVNYLLGNPDCIRNNSNNYYLYFTPEGKAYFIPYDYDRCLGITRDWNPDGSAMINKTPFSTKDCSGGDISNPLYRKTILDSSGVYRVMYEKSIVNILSGEWFTYSNFKEMYDAYRASYESVAIPSQSIIDACGSRVQMDRLHFSEDGADSFSGTEDNVSVKDYMEQKRIVAEKYI